MLALLIGLATAAAGPPVEPSWCFAKALNSPLATKEIEVEHRLPPDRAASIARLRGKDFVLVGRAGGRRTYLVKSGVSAPPNLPDDQLLARALHYVSYRFYADRSGNFHTLSFSGYYGPKANYNLPILVTVPFEISAAYVGCFGYA